MTLATKFTAPCPATESHIVLFDICLTYVPRWASQVAIVVKNLPPNAGDAGAQVSIPGSGRFPGGGNPLQYSSLENPWTEESGWLQSIASQRIRHDWASKHMFLDMRILSLSFCEFMYLCISNCLKKEVKKYIHAQIYFCICVCVGGWVLSHVWLFENPCTISVHGIFQARILEWVAISSSNGSSQPTGVSLCLLRLLLWQASSLPLSHQGSPPLSMEVIRSRTIILRNVLKASKERHQCITEQNNLE